MKYNFWLVLVTLVWGTTFFIIKDTVANVDPFLLVFVRNFIAAFVMVLWLFYKDRKALLDKTAIIYGSILGFLLAAMYGAQTVGLKFTTSGHSAFITSSAVVMVPILMAMFYKERLSKIAVFSIFVVFAGLFLLTYDFQTAVNIGDYITIITALAYAAHIILSGRYVKKSHMLSLITYQFVFSAFFSMLAFFVTGGELAPFSGKSILALLHLGLAGTLFCYFVTVWIQKYLGSTRISLVFSLEPVFAAIFAYLAIGEKFGMSEFVGSFCILAGVVLYQMKDRLREMIMVKVRAMRL